jgi:hypothetical protein
VFWRKTETTPYISSLPQHRPADIPPSRSVSGIVQGVVGSIAVHAKFLIADDVDEIELAIVAEPWNALAFPKILVNLVPEFAGQLDSIGNIVLGGGVSSRDVASRASVMVSSEVSAAIVASEMSSIIELKGVTRTMVARVEVFLVVIRKRSRNEEVVKFQ